MLHEKEGGARSHAKRWRLVRWRLPEGNLLRGLRQQQDPPQEVRRLVRPARHEEGPDEGLQSIRNHFPSDFQHLRSAKFLCRPSSTRAHS